MNDGSISGFFNLDKPIGLTSHDAVAAARRVFAMKRVGHCGTLDPLATGVLVLCLGEATRLSEYVMASAKQYRAQVHLGRETDTYDAEGRVLIERDADHVTLEAITRALPEFTGDILQVPPPYSAIKQGGQKLYALARSGQQVSLEPRPVRIDTIHVVSWRAPELVLEVTCGAGTYIRSLAHDLGELLGTGGSLTGLRRTASGRFRIDDAITLEALQAADDPRRWLTPAEIALEDQPRIALSHERARRLRLGQPVDSGPDDPPMDVGYVFGFDDAGQLVAVLQPRGGKWWPHKVFTNP